MNLENALSYWKSKYKAGKDYKDEHWEADERHEHEDYVNAVRLAIESIQKVIDNDSAWIGSSPFTDTIECKNCGYQLPSVELVSKYCPDCGHFMLNYEELAYSFEDGIFDEKENNNESEIIIQLN